MEARLLTPDEAARWLEARAVSRCDRGPGLAWTVADVVAVRTLLRQRKRLLLVAAVAHLFDRRRKE